MSDSNESEAAVDGSAASPGYASIPSWSEDIVEGLLRQGRGSLTVSGYWSIGFNGLGWQVFYCAIDAAYRLCGEAIDHESCRAAWEWLRNLSPDEIDSITSKVKA